MRPWASHLHFLSLFLCKWGPRLLGGRGTRSAWRRVGAHRTGRAGSPPLTPAPAGQDLPSASSGARPGGTAPPSSGTEVRSPSHAAAPGVTGARLSQGQRPGDLAHGALRPASSLPQAPRMQLPGCTKTHYTPGHTPPGSPLSPLSAPSTPRAQETGGSHSVALPGGWTPCRPPRQPLSQP